MSPSSQQGRALSPEQTLSAVSKDRPRPAWNGTKQRTKGVRVLGIQVKRQRERSLGGGGSSAASQLGCALTWQHPPPRAKSRREAGIGAGTPKAVPPVTAKNWKPGKCPSVRTGGLKEQGSSATHSAGAAGGGWSRRPDTERQLRLGIREKTESQSSHTAPPHVR